MENKEPTKKYLGTYMIMMTLFLSIIMLSMYYTFGEDMANISGILIIIAIMSAIRYDQKT